MEKLSTGSEILKKLLDTLNVTVYELANNCGYEREQAFYDVINGKTKRISFEMAKRIVSVYPNVSLDFLYSGQEPVFIKSSEDYKYETRPRIPMSASAGVLSVAIGGVTIDSCEQIPVVKSFSKYDYTILVKGDSMEPEFHSGDEVACLSISNGDFIQWGKYYVLDTKQGILIKRIFDDEDYIVCRSEESDLFPDFRIHKAEIFNLGLVVGMLRRF